MSNLIERLRGRAESYRQSGPSAEHTAELLDEAAAYIASANADYDRLRAAALNRLGALQRLLANKAAFDQSGSCNQADAYYCLIKRRDADWKAAADAVSGAAQ